MLKVAIVGCGKIADDHLQQIRRIAECQIVGVCDRELLMAKQLAERFDVPLVFDDVSELLANCQPHVVHITTPPHTHFSLAIQCLNAGAHIYVEKPFTLTSEEARKVITTADERGLKVTVGHDLQFSPGARRLRELARAGYLGERPLHMESYYCYDLGDPRYAKALLADADHWIRKLPGKLLQNVISHGIARIAEFLAVDSPLVIAQGFTSAVLRQIGENDIVDELRVIVTDGSETTAYFTFSSQMRPLLNLFRIYGSANGIELDQERETVIRLPGERYKSFAEKFLPPFGIARQQVTNVATNLRKFFANDFHAKAGMKYLIESFYDSIKGELPVPIPYREIVLTATIMDSIFAQLGPGFCKSVDIPVGEPVYPAPVIG